MNDLVPKQMWWRFNEVDLLHPVREILRFSVPDGRWLRTARDETLPCKQWHNIKAVTVWMNSDSEASGEWEES